MFSFLTDLAKFDFLQYALITGLLAAVAAGIMGTYVVTRRITYIAGGISHSVLGGMGAALYLQKVYGCTWCDPLYGAMAGSIVAALVIGFVSLRAGEREDTVIGAIWALGMAVGILFISRTPGYNADLMSYLFGNILLISARDLWILAALDAFIVLVVIGFYNKFLAVCFDEEFAFLRGLNTEFYYLLLLCLIALTVVILVSVVGIVMVIALLTLPTAVAGFVTRTMRQMMVMSVLICAALTTAGLVVSYEPNYPAGATTIVIAGLVYLAAIVIRSLVARFSADRGSDAG